MSGLERVSRRGDAAVVVLFGQEIQVLRWVLDDLTRVMRDTAPTDAAHERLFRRAYLDPTEEEAEEQWQSLVHGELVDARVSAVSELRRALDGATPARADADAREIVLGDEQMALWIGVVNDARLAIGTVLGVSADSDAASVEPASPTFELWVVYDWLTSLLASLLGAADTGIADLEIDDDDEDGHGDG